jgi:hypothetical protein
MAPISQDILLLAIGAGLAWFVSRIIAWADQRPSRNRPYDQEVD